MPVVPEENVCSDTIDELNYEDNGAYLKPPEAPSDVSDADGAELDASLKSLKSPSSASNELIRQSSDPSANGDFMKKMKPTRQPKTKLTFVNGQFVDLSTKEGQEIVKASSPEAEGELGGIGGILTSFKSGHCGILGPPSLSAGKDCPSLNPYAIKTPGRLASAASFGRARSDGSAASITSTDSVSTQSSFLSTRTVDVKDAVTSIVALGNRHFLTASKCDRVIKMWKLEDTSGKTTLQFVRDFVGHSTGITCLAKVDDKGRFLSASKDKVIKLWDSRFNCDDENDNAQQTLLATFDKLDQRFIHEIAITEDGTYVRPTDSVDMAMAGAMTVKAMKEGSASVRRAAKERQIIACSCEFATVSGRHPVVKIWSVKHVQEDEKLLSVGGNVAEVKLEHELKHDSVVESIASVRRKGILLTGDRMGNVRLWLTGKNVFLPGTARVWSCVRTFSWRLKSELFSVDESMKFAITSVSFLQGNALFVSGSKSGNLRVWNVDGTKTNGETMNKELICITGAHNLAITAIQQGSQVTKDVEKSLSFSSASFDGKVLSFAIPVAKIGGGCNPCCFNAVNHGIRNRYVVEADITRVTSLACLNMPSNGQDVLITGSTNSKGSINVLNPPRTPKKGQQKDALVLHRQAIEEESLTLYAIAEKICNGGVEYKNRKLQMKTYKNCSLGSDIVTYLVDHEYAVSRKDAVHLGCILATHLSLFHCITKTGKSLEDDSKSYYTFSSEFPHGAKASLKKSKLKKWSTEPNLDKHQI
eukprot:CAMPEP_0172313454 /NCGR_PEP_ID=MMETSP1058-20130122/20196_1 /TAXON_ID=83371 /ORGANISM="Detonula confervacea, Strain CCMP 353" /LENGTH=758 /DNA_ID=CAMNT_0013027101 /DNA_START=227 /DNA_END=2503 /DNA_ORIENTATION=-